MAIDAKGNSHKAAGRPDGGQFDRKAGQGTDDDLDMTPERGLKIAGNWLEGQRVAAFGDADAAMDGSAYCLGKGREAGYEYAGAIVDAALHADDIPDGTTLTDTAFDDDALGEYMADMGSGDNPDDLRAAAARSAKDAATPGARADRELGVMEDFALNRMRDPFDDDAMLRAMGFASSVIEARDTLRRLGVQ